MFTAVLYLFRPFILFSFLLILTLFLSRVGLAFWQLDRFDDIQSVATLIFNGLRIDLSTLGYLLVLPAMLHPWFMLSKHNKVWLTTLKIVFFFGFMAVVFFELATPAFIMEYGFRPNRLFIEYLDYPNEVMKMLCNGHLLTLGLVFISLIVLGSICWPLLNKIVGLQKTANRPALIASALSSVVMLLVLFLCARGTIGHRPINPSLVYFSTDPLVNSLTLNSLYSVAHAYKQFGNEKNAAKLYGNMDNKKVISLVRQETGLAEQSFKDKTQPSLSSRDPVYKGKPKNLVIILEESLGAQFVSTLGGLPLTPQIDKLNSEGWAFKQLYATGTRSVRGIEAVITGFTPTPARAVVKLDKSQRDFFTIASLLRNNGYTTQFIYGGESHFDNMKSFFLGNGFTDIVDFKDFEDPKFVASWGACDRDLFNQADIELTKLHNSNKPFLSFIFSSSNHDPFEIPEGIVTPIEYSDEQLSQYDEKERRRHQAIQYADFALGEFIDKAKTRPYWQDTVFLVVADHDARALGNNLVPIKNFHIPGVILNSTKGHVSDERITSQIDLAPTLLSQMGIINHSPMLGHDMNDPQSSGRAMMQYAENFAYMEGNEVTILQPQKPATNFIYDFKQKTLTPTQMNPALAEIALAHALWGSLAYKNAWYRGE
ncbi:LTA synthase family protein [Paraglaciecola arctica]|uniref:Sulfatase n=1 Tax=Paraglaciecola arctica BSs20135 TaxID=493475 RepID=K6X9N1_9ALTE|nr:LTA synthase family protein [Paraglaciecola arctica]GAC17304.1 sulfatase [Paraglaciecola arctica BSs20135]